MFLHTTPPSRFAALGIRALHPNKRSFGYKKAMLARTAAEPSCPLFRVFSPGPLARAQKGEIHIGCCNLEWSKVYWEIERS